ncbi:esterase/lipase family protein [Nocardia sp. NPDC052566]|uniref:esterase/lipase family protein n=1 Tax=Nocardia sp. NPDC052566 TaxID=3364330 RepID=UPI0037C95E92
MFPRVLRVVAGLATVTALISAGPLQATASPEVSATPQPPAAAQQSAAADRVPVVFVHGYKGGAWNFDEMRADFRNDGWPADRLFAIDYSIFQSNRDIAGILEKYVDDVLRRTGASKVDIVAHSMGSLNSRWYIKYLSGASKVRSWLSLGGPNHGTKVAKVCGWGVISCEEMEEGSQFLGELNAGDETPGSVRYATYWSSCDLIIVPNRSVLVEGAQNNYVGCVDHLGLVWNDDVSRQVRGFLKQGATS